MTTTQTLANHHAYLVRRAAAHALGHFQHAKDLQRQGFPGMAHGVLVLACRASESAHRLASLQARYDCGDD